MAKRLARCLCVSSLLLCATLGAQVRERPFLSQKQLEEPATVAAWLKKNGATADRKRAAQAHAFGVSEEQRGSLDSAVKGYGESAIRLPSPHALIAYADIAVRYYGKMRAAKNDHAQFQQIDLRSFEMLYRSALASDDVLPALSRAERRRIGANADCLATYRRSGTGYATCAPLQVYNPGKK